MSHCELLLCLQGLLTFIDLFSVGFSHFTVDSCQLLDPSKVVKYVVSQNQNQLQWNSGK